MSTTIFSQVFDSLTVNLRPVVISGFNLRLITLCPIMRFKFLSFTTIKAFSMEIFLLKICNSMDVYCY